MLEEPEAGAAVPLAMVGVPVLEAELEPDEGAAVAIAVGVVAAPPEELLEDGLVGQSALPVTGTAGVVVPEGLTAVPVPTAPLGALGEGVPLAVLGAGVPAGVPVVGMVVAAWVKTEVEDAAEGDEAAGVPVPPVTGTPAVPVAD